MKRRLVVRGVLALLGLTAVALAARAVLYQGWLAPIRVVSGSMAESLVGEHFLLTCADCGIKFRCDRALPPPEMRAVCPNCGYREVPVDANVWQPGERVLIDQLVALGLPRRWEVVAFHSPERPEELSVKRVVGLPGERIAIRAGDLYVNGRIARKDLAQQRQMAILVHDNDHRPNNHPLSERTAGLPPRWQADADETGWKSNGGEFMFVASAATGNVQSDEHREPALDWLTYRHWRCVHNPLPRSEEAPISDNYGYNQGLSRQLQIATDLMFVCRLRVSGPGRLVLRINNGRDAAEAAIEPAGEQARLFLNGSQRASASWPAANASRTLELVFSTVDDQALLAVDGEVVLQAPFDRSDRPLAPTSRPLAIGARQVDAQVEQLCTFRDVHYLDPRGFGEPWEAPALADDELFVLGDNVPISRDSRAWQAPLRRESLIGGVTPRKTEFIPFPP